MENGMQMTLEECMPGTFQKQIAGASDSLARISQLPKTAWISRKPFKPVFRVMYLIGQLEEEDKPTYLFIENVKNLLSVNGGWDFARLLIEMEQGGYDAEWQVFNSKDFGVPQNRERVFIIGHLRGRSTSEVFPVEGANGKIVFT